MVLFWLCLIVLLIIVEIASFNLITIWFAIGALGAFITTYFTDNVITQLVVFTLVTTILLIFTRPLVKRYIGFIPQKINLDAVVNKDGVVTKEITNNEYGRVKVEGREWTAKATGKIKVGVKVEVLAIEGVKLVVRKKEEK